MDIKEAKRITGLKVIPINDNNKIIKITLIASKQKNTDGKWLALANSDGNLIPVAIDYSDELVKRIIENMHSNNF